MQVSTRRLRQLEVVADGRHRSEYEGSSKRAFQLNPKLTCRTSFAVCRSVSYSWSRGFQLVPDIGLYEISYLLLISLRYLPSFLWTDLPWELSFFSHFFTFRKSLCFHVTNVGCTGDFSLFVSWVALRCGILIGAYYLYLSLHAGSAVGSQNDGFRFKLCKRIALKKNSRNIRSRRFRI